MDLKDVEAFLTLADDLNFTRSADRLFISQPAFSRQIAKLEEEYGCEFFIRSKRNVQLTEYGKYFLKYAQRIYNENEKWNLHLKQLKHQNIGNLKIGFLQDLYDSAFSEIVRYFTAENPDVGLTFRDCNMSEIIDGLKRNTFDCAFSLSTEIHELNNIETLVISSVPMCAVMPDTHRLAGRTSIRLEELSSESFVTMAQRGYEPGTRHLQYLCKRAGFDPIFVAMASQVSGMLIMVQCGVGITILAQKGQDMAPAGVVFIPLEDEAACANTVLCWHNDNSNEFITTFVDIAKEIAT